MAEFTPRPSFSFLDKTRGGRLLSSQLQAQGAAEAKSEKKRIANQEKQVAFITEGKLEKQIINTLAAKASTFERETFDPKSQDKLQSLDDAFHPRNPRKGFAKNIRARFVEAIENPENADFTPQQILKSIVDKGEEDVRETLVDLRRRKTTLGNRLVSDEDIFFPEDVKQEADFRDFQSDFAEKAIISASRLDELRTGVTADGQQPLPLSEEEKESLIKGGPLGESIAKAAIAGVDLRNTDVSEALTVGAITSGGAAALAKAGVRPAKRALTRSGFSRSAAGTAFKVFKGANLASIPASVLGGPAAVAVNLARLGLSAVMGDIAFQAGSRAVEKFVTRRSPAAALENPVSLEVAKFAAGVSPLIGGAKLAKKFVERSQIQFGSDLSKASDQLSLIKVDNSIQRGLKTPIENMFRQGDQILKNAIKAQRLLRPQKLLTTPETAIAVRPTPSVLKAKAPLKPSDITIKPAGVKTPKLLAQRSGKPITPALKEASQEIENVVTTVSPKAPKIAKGKNKLADQLNKIKASKEVKDIASKTPEKVVSASKVVEGEAKFIKEFAKIARDDAVDPSTKFVLNQTRRRLILEGGMSEEQASSIAVTIAKGAKVAGKTASEITAKVKPKVVTKSVNPVHGINQVAEDVSERLFKVPFNELTTAEQFQVIKEVRKGTKGKDLFGLAAFVAATSVFAPTDADAGIIDGSARLAKAMFGKIPAEKIAAQAAKKLSTEDAKFTVNAAKEAGLNLDSKTVEAGKLNALDITFGSVFNNLKKLGKEGETLKNLFLAEDGITERAIVEQAKKFANTLPISSFKKERFAELPKFMTNLPRKEQLTIRGLLDGSVKNGPRKLVETAAKIRFELDDLFKQAKDAGIDVVGYRKNYIPQIAIPEYFQSPKNQKKFVEFLLKGDGKIGPQVKTREEAIKHLERILKDSSDHVFTPAGSKAPKQAGFIEKSRRLTLPDEAVIGGTSQKFGSPHFLESLQIYSEQVIRRINQAKLFGVNNEKVKPLIDTLVKNNPEAAEYIKNSFTVLQHKNPSGIFFNAPKLFNKTSATVRAIESIDLLGYAGISQLGQSLFTVSKFGVINTLKGAMKLAFDKGTKDLVKASAAVSPHQHRFLLEQYGATRGAASNISRTALQFYGVTSIDKLMRKTAASTGAEYAKDVLQTLAKNPKSGLAIRQLQELGVDTTRVLKDIASRRKVSDPINYLNDGEILEAMKRASDMTQFRSRHGDMPLWFRSDWAKVPVQFKSFVFQAGSMINQHIIKEATGANGQRNLAPLMRAMTLSPFVGSGVLELRDDAKELVGKALGAPGSYYRTLGKFRRDLNDRSGGPLSKPRGIFADNSIHRVLHDATYALAPGVVADAMQDLFQGRAKAALPLGPGTERIIKLGNALFKDLENQEIDALEKELKAGLDSPVLGPAIRAMGIVDRFKTQ